MTDPSGWKQFTDGQVLPATEIRGYLQQGVLVFDDDAARDSALVGFLREGMVAYSKDTDVVSYYDGVAWNVITGQIAFADVAARDAAIPNPVDGRYAFTTDLNRLWLRSSGAWVLQNAPGDADFSNTATGTFTDGGASFKFVTFTSTGTLTITRTGFAEVLVVSGGGGGTNVNGPVRGGGGGGGFVQQSLVLAAGSYTVTIGGGGAGASSSEEADSSRGGDSSLGTLVKTGGGGASFAFNVSTNTLARTFGDGGGAGGAVIIFTGGALSQAGNGAGGTTFGATGSDGRASLITNSSVTYAAGGLASGSANAAANTGNGGPGGGFNGGSGIVIVKVRT